MPLSEGATMLVTIRERGMGWSEESFTLWAKIAPLARIDNPRRNGEDCRGSGSRTAGLLVIYAFRHAAGARMRSTGAAATVNTASTAAVPISVGV